MWLKKTDSQKILSHLSFVVKTGVFESVRSILKRFEVLEKSTHKHKLQRRGRAGLEFSECLQLLCFQSQGPDSENAFYAGHFLGEAIGIGKETQSVCPFTSN